MPWGICDPSPKTGLYPLPTKLNSITGWGVSGSVGMNRTGGPSSYVELQSCLIIMKDAKVIKNNMALAEPLVNKGQLNTQALAASDIDDDGSNNNGGKKARRARKRNDR